MWGIQQHTKISKATRTCGSQNFPIWWCGILMLTSLNTPFFSFISQHTLPLLSFYLSSSFLWSYISFHTLTKTSTTTATKNSNSRDKQYCFLKANTQRERERERERENLVFVETYKHKNRMLELKDPAIKLFGKTIPLPLRKQTLTNESSVAEDCSDQNLYSPNISSSSREESSAREREGNKVCMCHVLYRVWISFDMCGLCFFFFFFFAISRPTHFWETRNCNWVSLVFTKGFGIMGVKFCYF